MPAASAVCSSHPLANVDFYPDTALDTNTFEAAPNPTRHAVDQEPSENAVEPSLQSGSAKGLLTTIPDNALCLALDVGDRTVKFFDRTVDTTTGLVRSTVPWTSNLVTGFVLPEHLNKLFTKSIGLMTTCVAETLGLFTKTVFRTATLGMPEWLQMFRQRFAVLGTIDALKDVHSSSDLRIKNFIGTVKDEPTREALSRYAEKRAEAKSLALNAKNVSLEALRNLNREISSIESAHERSQEFTFVRSLIETPQLTIQNNIEQMRKVASETARALVDGVEHFYEAKLGILGGKVESGRGSDERRTKARTKLETTVAGRLFDAYQKDLNAKETDRVISYIQGDLLSSFGAYRKMFRAALYSLGALVPIPTGNAPSGFAGEIASGVAEASKGIVGASPSPIALPDSLASGAQDFLNWAGFDRGLNFFPAIAEYLAWGYELSAKSAGKAAEIGWYYTGAAVRNSGEYMLDRLEDGLQYLIGQVWDHGTSAAQAVIEAPGRAIMSILPEGNPDAHNMFTGTLPPIHTGPVAAGFDSLAAKVHIQHRLHEAASDPTIPWYKRMGYVFSSGFSNFGGF